MKRYLKWMFFFACLGLILYLNLQDGETSMNLLNKTGEVVAAVAVVEKSWIQKHFRKLGHVGEYFLLGISSYFCFGFKSIGIDAGVSFIDQCFKGLIPVRHYDWTDFPYDIVGYIGGCCVGYVGKKILNMHEGENSKFR